MPKPKDMKKSFFIACIVCLLTLLPSSCTNSVAQAQESTEETENTNKDIYFKEVFPEYVAEAEQYLAEQTE